METESVTGITSGHHVIHDKWSGSAEAAPVTRWNPELKLRSSAEDPVGSHWIPCKSGRGSPAHTTQCNILILHQATRGRCQAPVRGNVRHSECGEVPPRGSGGLAVIGRMCREAIRTRQLVRTCSWFDCAVCCRCAGSGTHRTAWGMGTVPQHKQGAATPWDCQSTSSNSF